MLLRIFYFLWDFSEKTGLSVSSLPAENLDEDDFLQIVSRFITFQDKITGLLDEFYEEVDRFKTTGSFETIWDEFVSDPNER